MSVLEKYDAEKKIIHDNLQRLETLICDLHTNEKHRKDLLMNHSEIKIDAENLMKNEFPIAVLANWNAGKSTFLNALMGMPILPMRNKPYTSGITRIRYGEEPKLTINYTSGEVEEVPLTSELEEDFLVKYVTVDGDGDGDASKGSSVHEVTVEYPLDICKEGIVLIDTPGVNSINDSHDKVTFQVIPNAKAIIMLVTADSAGGAEEVEFLKRVLIGRDKNDYEIYFVINKIESISSEDLEDAIDSIKQAIRKVVDDNDNPIIENPIIIPISAYAELQFKLYQNRLIKLEDLALDQKLFYKNKRGRRRNIQTLEDVENLPAVSNFKQLEEHLNNTFIGLDTTKRLLSSIKTGLWKLCAEDIGRYLTRNIRAIEQDNPSDKLLVEAKEVQQKLEEASMNKTKFINEYEQEMDGLIDHYVENVQDDWRNKVHYDLNSYIDDLPFKKLKKDGTSMITQEFQRLIQKEYYQSSHKMKSYAEEIINRYVTKFQIMVIEIDKEIDELNINMSNLSVQSKIELSSIESEVESAISDTTRIMITGGLAIGGMQTVGLLLGAVLPVIGHILGAVIGGFLSKFFGPGEKKVKRDVKENLATEVIEQCDQAFQKQRSTIVETLEEIRNNGIEFFNDRFKGYQTMVENSYKEILGNINLQHSEQQIKLEKLRGDLGETKQILGLLEQVQQEERIVLNN
jgi:hypothetical protein